MKLKQKKSQREISTVIVLAILVLCNLGLAITKLYIGLANYSLPIIIDATNNFFDIISALLVIFGFIYMIAKKGSIKITDKTGRAEYAVNFLSNLILLGLGVMFLYFSSIRLNLPAPESQFSWVHFATLMGTVLIKVAMGVISLFSYRKLKAKALSIITTDNFLDSGMTFFVAITYILRLRNVRVVLDGIFGIILSLVVCGIAIKMLIETWNQLIGIDNKKERNSVIESIKQVIPNHQCGDLMLHDYGLNNKFGYVKVGCTSTEIRDLFINKEKYQNEIFDLCGVKIHIEYIDFAERQGRIISTKLKNSGLECMKSIKSAKYKSIAIKKGANNSPSF